VPSYPVDELPPNHRALVELLVSLKVGSAIVTDNEVLITYNNRAETLFVRTSNVSSNGS
jgi:hypothetical protein